MRVKVSILLADCIENISFKEIKDNIVNGIDYERQLRELNHKNSLNYDALMWIFWIWTRAKDLNEFIVRYYYVRTPFVQDHLISSLHLTFDQSYSKTVLKFIHDCGLFGKLNASMSFRYGHIKH